MYKAFSWLRSRNPRSVFWVLKLGFYFWFWDTSRGGVKLTKQTVSSLIDSNTNAAGNSTWKLQSELPVGIFSICCNLQATLITDNLGIRNRSIEFRKLGIQVQPQLRNYYPNIFLHRILSLFSEAFPKLFRTMAHLFTVK